MSDTDREQIRRDAEEIINDAKSADGVFMPRTAAVFMAQEILALIAELEQAEQGRATAHNWHAAYFAELGKTRGLEARLEQAGHETEAFRLALSIADERAEQAGRERDERERAAVLEGERRIDALEARLAKTDALAEALRELVDCADSLALYPEGAVGVDSLAEAQHAAEKLLAAWEQT